MSETIRKAERQLFLIDGVDTKIIDDRLASLLNMGIKGYCPTAEQV